MKMLIGDKRWQRWLSLGGLVVIIGSCFWMPQSAPAEAQAQPTDIVTPVHVPSTTTPVVLPVPTGEAIRVNFPLGSYGTAIFGTGSQKYLLWAKAGQAWNLHQMGKGYSNLIGPDGKTLYQEAGAGMTITTTLTATGDQILEIRASGQFTVGVEIR